MANLILYRHLSLLVASPIVQKKKCVRRLPRKCLFNILVSNDGDTSNLLVRLLLRHCFKFSATISIHIFIFFIPSEMY